MSYMLQVVAAMRDEALKTKITKKQLTNQFNEIISSCDQHTLAYIHCYLMTLKIFMPDGGEKP
ncbi:hypothetical protein [Paenibacillus sedimenti]|uniref:Uncharacterized protein n=1 Tax=Paenibacillus sedimenti TaxID=2770274 RepID=A0A926KS34_9BACL|nr:hypothetical protein [Paenibacillus sedimenti]MBD0381248.1 hypothetical protein [Paenibacillus sedimenti]